MVPFLVLAPAIVALILLYFRPASQVMLKVYLPCLMLLPLYLLFNIAGIAIDVTTFVACILAVAGLFSLRGEGGLRLLDFCVFGNVVSLFLSDAQHGKYNIGLYATIQEIGGSMLPYIIGRTLVEQSGLRTKVAKTIVVCLVIVAILSTWEYRMISNPFQTAVETLTHTRTGWYRQIRWGFSRIAGPYAHAIFAGMVFTTGLMLQLWLAHAKKWHFSKPRGGTLVTLAVLAGLFMTQSRGPWIGCILGLIVASSGFFRDHKRVAFLSIIFLSLALMVTAVFLSSYTAPTGKSNVSHDEDQQNAEYRRRLWDTYEPLVKEGGLLGLGSAHMLPNGDVGWSMDQPSIDNEYLRRAVSQGYIGTSLLVLIFAVAMSRLVVLCYRLEDRSDITFVYCMLGILTAASFTLTTVALTEPMVQVLFFVLGWSASIRFPSKHALASSAQQYEFKRVFV